jgi:alpha 1,3-glucosidase
MVRYSLLPLWYTIFYEAYSTGVPVMRTMFTEFPDDPACFALDDQWLVGSALLVKPVTDEGAESTEIYLPRDAATGTDKWYDLITLIATAPSASATEKTHVEVPLAKIPVFIRSGTLNRKGLHHLKISCNTILVNTRPRI